MLWVAVLEQERGGDEESVHVRESCEIVGVAEVSWNWENKLAGTLCLSRGGCLLPRQPQRVSGGGSRVQWVDPLEVTR